MKTLGCDETKCKYVDGTIRTRQFHQLCNLKSRLNTKVNVENKLPSNLKGESGWWLHQVLSFSFQKWRIELLALCSLHVL